MQARINLMEAESRERIAKTARELFPHVCRETRCESTGATLRIHVPSEGVSWVYAIGSLKGIPGTKLDSWNDASRNDCAQLARVGVDQIINGNIGAVARIRGGSLAVWGIPTRSGTLLAVATAHMLGLMSRELATAMSESFGGGSALLFAVLDTVYGS